MFAEYQNMQQISKKYWIYNYSQRDVQLNEYIVSVFN